MPDLPDYYTMTTTPFVVARAIQGGAEVSLPADCEAEDLYLATDTERLWYSIVDTAWRAYFMSSRLLTANSMLYATADYIPAALTVAASRIVGRKAAGDIGALTGAETMAILSGQAAAGFSLNGQYLTYACQIRGCGTHNLIIQPHSLTTDATERDVLFRTLNAATDAWVEVFRCEANGATPTLKMAKVLNMNSQLITNLPAPTLDGHAARKKYVDDEIADHADDTTAVHGVGASTIASVGNLTTHAALTATHGVAVAIVGTTDVQTLTNKTLTAPVIAVIAAGAQSVQINTTGANRGLDIYSTQNGTTGVRIRARQISANPAIDNIVLFIEGDGKDSGGSDQSYCMIEFMIEDPTATAEKGKFRFRTIVGAAWNTAMTLSSAGALWLDAGLEVGADIVMATHKITGLGDPAAAQDAATKAYVDARALITSGQYTGNDTVDRDIAHSLGVVPKIVFIVYSCPGDDTGDSTFQIMTGIARIFRAEGGVNSSLGVTEPDATDFHVGNATQYEYSANKTDYVYFWVALA